MLKGLYTGIIIMFLVSFDLTASPISDQPMSNERFQPKITYIVKYPMVIKRAGRGHRD